MPTGTPAKGKKRKARQFKDAKGTRIVVAYDGGHTGELLRKRDPAKYERILGMLTLGHTYRQIREETGADLRTIGAINHNHGGANAVAKKVAMNLRSFAVDASEQLAEQGVDKIGLRNIPFALAVAIDKAQLLSGHATAITEQRTIVSSADEWAKAFEIIKIKAEAKKLELTENTVVDTTFTQHQQPEQ